MGVVTKKAQEFKRNVIDAALYRMRLGTETALQLAQSALAADDAEALAVADLIEETARVENLFTADDLHNADGELFEGYGSLVLSSSRLCPAYMAASSRRARKRATEVLARVRPQSGEHLRLLTVTLPKLRASFDETLKVLDTALVLLKKRKWFKANVRGAVIGEESTLGAENDHYHAHAHMLAWSKWIVWSELGEQWTDCLLEAAAKLGVTVEIETEHGRAVVDVRLVTSKRRGKGTVSMSDAVQEVCKYIVKGSDFAKMPQEQLCEIEKALRGRQMIRTFGECNAQRGKARRGKASAGQNTYLDTQCITDGEDSSQSVEIQEGEREENRGSASVSEATSQASGSERGGEASEASGRPDRFKFGGKRSRGRPLREVGAEMIRRGEREKWRELLRAVYQRRREWRMAQLARRFPYATFRTLDGRVWYGVGVMP